MRDNIEIYKIWAPENSVWAQWAKPVLFMHQFVSWNTKMEFPSLTWTVAAANPQTMIILDLPGERGVVEGIGLAKLGYRPVPLYNGVNGPMSNLVKVDQIVRALFQGADDLISCSIPQNAPPVFLLDSNRMSGFGKRPGCYDNRWCVFPQDMPSASFLINQGIKRILLRSEWIQNDLTHILRRYQDGGIEIYLSKEGEHEEKVNVVKPSKFRSLSYRCSTLFGFSRNAAGGFGAVVPEPTQSSSSRHYGFG